MRDLKAAIRRIRVKKSRQIHSVFERNLPRTWTTKWVPVRVKKTRQNNDENPGSDAIRTRAPAAICGGIGRAAARPAELRQPRPDARPWDGKSGGPFQGRKATSRSSPDLRPAS